MCIHVDHVDRNPWETDAEYANRSRRGRVEQWPCRQCRECAVSGMNRVRSDFIAHKMTCQRVLVVLLTYNPVFVEQGGNKPDRKARRNVAEMLEDIPQAARDGTEFCNAFRAMFRRLHPDMLFDLKMYRVPEIAMHQTDRGVDPDAGFEAWMKDRNRPRALDKPAQVHLHAYVAMSVEWKDADRQRREPAQWSDSLIPNLKLDYLYDHQWESAEEASKRGGKWVTRTTHSLKHGWRTWSVWRGGRVTKTTTPWRWGYIGYQNDKGGVGDYLSKYLGKSMLTIEEYNNPQTRGVWSPEKQTDLDRAVLSWKKTRKSPGIGYKYYTRVGEWMAEAGLPLSLYFRFGSVAAVSAAVGVAGQVPMRDPSTVTMADLVAEQWRRLKAASAASFDLADAPYQRKILVDTGNHSIDEWGRVRSETITRKVPPECILQRVGRYRRIIEAYDRRWAELYGERPQPVGSTLREKRIPFSTTQGRGLNAKPVTSYKYTQTVVYGVESARVVLDKDNDNRYIGKRQREIDREVKDNPDVLASLVWLKKAARVADELRLELKHFNLDDDPLKIVKAWEFKFEREVWRNLDRLDDVQQRPEWLYSKGFLFYWLRFQPALLRFSDVAVEAIRRSMDNRWRGRMAKQRGIYRPGRYDILDRKIRRPPGGKREPRFTPGEPMTDPIAPLADARVW